LYIEGGGLKGGSVLVNIPKVKYATASFGTIYIQFSFFLFFFVFFLYIYLLFYGYCLRIIYVQLTRVLYSFFNVSNLQTKSSV